MGGMPYPKGGHLQRPGENVATAPGTQDPDNLKLGVGELHTEAHVGILSGEICRPGFSPVEASYHQGKHVITPQPHKFGKPQGNKPHVSAQSNDVF